MKKNLSDYIVALIVVACSALLVGALTIALSGWHGRGSRHTQDIDFPDVTGIHMRSEVRYAGAPAGSVIAMRLLSMEERRDASGRQRDNAVRVTVELRPGVPPLPEDVRASLSSDTLLSDKFVALSAGSPDAPPLALGVALQGRSAGGIEKLADSIGPLISSFEPLIKKVDAVLESIQPVLKKTGEAVDTLKGGLGDAFPRISKLADGLKSTSDSAELTLKHIDRLIGEVDEPIKSDLKEIKTALVQLDQTLGEAERFISHTDKNLGPRLQELAVILENLKVVSTHAKALTQALGEKPNRLIFSGKPKTLTPEAEILRSDKPLPAVVPAGSGGQR
jgi:ABC-type transporter Mla subunit MlaD